MEAVWNFWKSKKDVELKKGWETLVYIIGSTTLLVENPYAYGWTSRKPTKQLVGYFYDVVSLFWPRTRCIMNARIPFTIRTRDDDILWNNKAAFNMLNLLSDTSTLFTNITTLSTWRQYMYIQIVNGSNAFFSFNFRLSYGNLCWILRDNFKSNRRTRKSSKYREFIYKKRRDQATNSNIFI